MENNFPQSIKQSSQFLEITKKGRRIKVNSYLTLVIFKSDDDISYFGMTVSRKVGSAIIRNKLKRWVRVCVRSNEWLSKYKNYKVVFLFRSQPDGFYKQLEFKSFKNELFK